METNDLYANSPLLSCADLSWDEKGAPRSQQFDDVYFYPGSQKSIGWEETDYVFLQGNNLKERWQNLPAEKSHFTIIETGFGTGLNFFAAAELWEQSAPKDKHLHFISTEQFPLSHRDLHKALSALAETLTLAKRLLEIYPPPVKGFHQLTITDNITLTLLFGNAEDMLEALQVTTSPPLAKSHNPKADAWFLDGFSPARNPDMWSETIFSHMAKLSDTDTTFATFTAASMIKRRLIANGFAVQKRKGFAYKREMTFGVFVGGVEVAGESKNGETKQGDTNQKAERGYGPQWFVHSPLSVGEPKKHLKNKSIAVIGGGLGGCHIAYQLAQKGWKVDLFEKNSSLASEASGNRQGVLFNRLSHRNEPLGRFSFGAWLYSLRLYQQLFAEEKLTAPSDGDFSGVLQLITPKEAKHLASLKSLFSQNALQDWVQFLTAEQASKKAGTLTEHEAIWFPSSGWVSPIKVCQALTQHPNINVHTGHEVQQLKQHTDTGKYKWELSFCQQHSQEPSQRFDQVVIANSISAKQLEQTADLPLTPVRGQVTHSPRDKNPPLCTICHEGYVTPPLENTLSFGASFISKDDDLALRQTEQQQNVEQQRKYLPQLAAEIEAALSNNDLAGRSGIRTTTPDYLPIVGPVCDPQALGSAYEAIKHNAKGDSDNPGSWQLGLYVAVGFGSRGLTYAPLSAALLAAQIEGATLPLDRQLLKALSPARFAIKKIIQQQTGS